MCVCVGSSAGGLGCVYVCVMSMYDKLWQQVQGDSTQHSY